MFFSDREKQIYQSPLGAKYDPVELFNRLESAGAGHLSALLAQWWGEDTPANECAGAAIQLAKIARSAFNLKPFDQPDGVLDAQVLETLYHFLEWREGKG